MGTAGSMCQGIGSLVENSIGLLTMTEPSEIGYSLPKSAIFKPDFSPIASTSYLTGTTERPNQTLFLRNSSSVSFCEFYSL